MNLANRANNQIQSINESTAKIFDKSKEMVVVIDSVAAIVEENSSATSEMSDGSKNVKKMVENISYVSSESAIAVREVASSGEEMRNVLEVIMGSAEILDNMAKEVERVTSQFKVE